MEKKFFQRPVLKSGLLRSVSEISSWPSISLGIAIYLGVFFLAWIGGELSAWYLAPLSFFIIAALQNHLLILLHEGAHGLVHPNKRVNDFATDVLCGIPLFMFLRNYRAFHMAHHQHTGDPDKDPEIPLYRLQGYHYSRRSGVKTLWMFVKDFFSFNVPAFLFSSYDYVFKLQARGKHRVFTVRELFLSAVFWSSLFTFLYVFDLWIYYFIFWLLPYFTLTFFLLKLHGYGEHTGAEGPTEFERSWFHEYSFVVNFFIYPIRSGYHLEHHLYPTVPWYRIQRLRAELLQNKYYASLAQKVTSKGYFFGEASILRTMIYGKGSYYLEDSFQKVIQEREKDRPNC